MDNYIDRAMLYSFLTTAVSEAPKEFFYEFIEQMRGNPELSDVVDRLTTLRFLVKGEE